MRNLTAGQLAAIASPQTRPALFASIAFTTGVLYVWTGNGSITWGGNTYVGIGIFGEISNVEDGASLSARGIVFTLSAFDPTLLTDVVTDFQLGLPASLFLGFFDLSGFLIDTPAKIWGGRTDSPQINILGAAATIRLACESRFIDLNTPVARRYTDADQQLDHPGDLAFSFVNQIKDITIYWGTEANKTNVI